MTEEKERGVLVNIGEEQRLEADTLPLAGETVIARNAADPQTA